MIPPKPNPGFVLSKKLWQTIYNFAALPAMRGLASASGLLAPVSRKAQKVHTGFIERTGVMAELKQQFATVAPDARRVWVHAASMGECEQAKPLLREIKSAFPHVVRVLTIFSPSARSNLNNPTIPAEIVCYLPIDTRDNARDFMHIVKPACGIIMRHDLWPNFLWQAERDGVFLLLADASVSANAKSARHAPVIRHFNREILANFHVVAAVSAAAADSLKPLLRHGDRLHVLGDTRFDQVLYRARAADLNAILPPRWIKHSPTLIAGSTWPSDEAVIIVALAETRKVHSELRMIIAPHEPTSSHLLSLEELLRHHGLSCTRLSQNDAESDVLIIDRVGVLAEVYAAGQLAIVGGSFGPGVHSVIEAAVHGLPVFFGPRMSNSAEAMEMKQQGIGVVVTNAAEFAAAMGKLLESEQYRTNWSERCREFVSGKAGASQMIVSLLERAILH